VIDRLAKNGIDLTRTPVEVAPIAHYHMGGVRVPTTRCGPRCRPLAAGEAVGGANGANRLSGNAITEALVFGREAGRTAAAHAKTMAAVPAPERWRARSGRADRERGEGRAQLAPNDRSAAGVMADDVGPLRTEAGSSARSPPSGR
jgi:succinate dehydrogenase / fumarate reductase, flavoprotein subunit